jgi:hypothetical protein
MEMVGNISVTASMRKFLRTDLNIIKNMSQYLWSTNSV